MSPSMVVTWRSRPWTGMVTWTGKLPRPMPAMKLKPVQPMRASAIGTPISRATQRPGVMRRSPGARGAPVVTGMVVMTCPRSSGAQVAQDGEYATVVAVTGRQPELGEDVVDVLFHRAA